MFENREPAQVLSVTTCTATLTMIFRTQCSVNLQVVQQFHFKDH